MKIIFTFLFMACGLFTLKAQYSWTDITYYCNYPSVTDNSKGYYIIKINTEGNGNLEISKGNGVSVIDFSLSGKSINEINSKLKKSGIYELDYSEKLSDKNDGLNCNCNMTINLVKDKEFYLKYQNKNYTNEEIVRKHKSPIITVSNFLDRNYSKKILDFYHLIEMKVPDKIWDINPKED